MKCTAMRNLLLRKIDHELTESESSDLDAHLERCSSCAREFRLLSLPGRIAQTVTPLRPSPYFYQTLRTRIESDFQNISISQLLFGLARRAIPSMAAVTLALLSVFTYLHLRDPQADLYTAYAQAFMGETLPFRMPITEQQNITDENILSAIANQEAWQKNDINLK
jgi:hypothetical protein